LQFQETSIRKNCLKVSQCTFPSLHLANNRSTIRVMLHSSKQVDFYSPCSYIIATLKISTVLNDRMANKLAIIVENPGARQLWAMKPSFSSARQMTSSPRRQSQLGMFSKYAWNPFKTGFLHRVEYGLVYLIMVLNQLDNDSDVRREIFNRNDPHDISCIFGIRVVWIFVCQYKASVSCPNLKHAKVIQSSYLVRSVNFLLLALQGQSSPWQFLGKIVLL